MPRAVEMSAADFTVRALAALEMAVTDSAALVVVPSGAVSGMMRKASRRMLAAVARSSRTQAGA